MAEKKKYQEDEKFVPNPTDMKGTLQTTLGGGGYLNVDQVSDVFAADRKAVAEKVLDDLDNNDGAGILFGSDAAKSATEVRSEAEASLRAAAEATLENDGQRAQDEAEAKGEEQAQEAEAAEKAAAEKAAAEKATSTRRGAAAKK